MEKLALIITGFIFGAVLGSFIKALADRSITEKTYLGRSHCEKCKKTLKWYDLIPVFSYLSTQGKCRYCQTKLSIEYLLVEVLTGLLISLVFVTTLPANFFELNILNQIDNVLDLIIKSFIVGVLIIVFLTDLKTGLIYDRITYPSIIIIFGLLLIQTFYKIFVLYQSLSLSPLGKYLLPPQSDYFYRHALFIAEPFLWSIAAAFLMILFFGSIIFLTKGRGMGGGDLKLSIFLGLALGFPQILVALMLSFLSGSVVGILLLLFGKKKFGQTIPFGPFLSLGSLTTLFLGPQILTWYLTKF